MNQSNHPPGRGEYPCDLTLIMAIDLRLRQSLSVRDGMGFRVELPGSQAKTSLDDLLGSAVIVLEYLYKEIFTLQTSAAMEQ